MPTRAKAFVAFMVAFGTSGIVLSFLQWHSANPLKFVCYLTIALLASTLKVKLPGMDSTMSVHFLFVLLGVLELTLAETLIIGCTAALIQSVWKTNNRPDPIKVCFNVAGLMSTAICLTYALYHLFETASSDSFPLLLVATGCMYFLGNTLPLATVIALAEGRSMRKIWSEAYFWGLPYNLAGAALVGVIHFANERIGWQNALLIVPIMYLVYRSYQLYLGRLEEQNKRIKVEELHVVAEKRHVEEVCALHLRTIESLALAIDAKDHNTHQHLHRVRIFAIELAKELGLSGEELDALRAAALLHDIGKLAVPDHIINKPGRLTPEEFEKMKIHPIVGAEILERASFPYPVTPIVRAHHERWNGKGYPDGLTGEEIPLGARILAAVDSLDALASDRQYRKALPLDEAMKEVASESGIAFDPKVIEVLKRRYRDLEKMVACGAGAADTGGQIFIGRVEQGDQPAAGFQVDFKYRQAGQESFLSSIASARHEAHTLYELSQDLGNSLSLDETLSLVAMRLRKLVPYDSIVAFIRKGNHLKPVFVSGDNFRSLSSLSIPIGTGLNGWVAGNCKPIINGNPAVELGVANDERKMISLRSALAVPLDGADGLVGVLTLYQADADAFTTDHLRILQAITSKLGRFIENALKYRQAEDSATYDFLTGLPNARALSIHLDQELARCKRENSSVAVLECDLNGFKEVNDRHGHLAGDKVLKIFATSMREICREYDYTARMGGDEFVMVVPALSPEAVQDKVRVLNAIALRASHEVCGQDIVSVSLGVAFYPQDGQDAEQLLTEADRRMYNAKQAHYRSSWRGLHADSMSSSLARSNEEMRPVIIN